MSTTTSPKHTIGSSEGPEIRQMDKIVYKQYKSNKIQNIQDQIKHKWVYNKDSCFAFCIDKTEMFDSKIRCY